MPPATKSTEDLEKTIAALIAATDGRVNIPHFQATLNLTKDAAVMRVRKYKEAVKVITQHAVDEGRLTEEGAVITKALPVAAGRGKKAKKSNASDSDDAALHGVKDKKARVTKSSKGKKGAIKSEDDADADAASDA